MDLKYIRNFSIIAHIDHGKSTLADRFLEFTKTLPPREMREQVLDNMDLERERGITIKAHAIRMNYKSKDGQEYILNLIDTPGHVDFTYEVSSSLAACEGALLVVDASQGVEAQTISNLFLALDNNLSIIPIINKIDLPSAQIELVKGQLKELLGVEQKEILLTSAKLGIGIEEILEAIIEKIPAPSGEGKNPLKGLIFDSVFDQYRGAIPYIRVKDGYLKKGDRIKFFFNQKIYEVDEVGYLRLKLVPAEKLSTGEVGYVIANVKNVTDTKVGDTITSADNPANEPLPGFRDIKSMVFSGFYPADSENYEELRDAMEKLKMNDASLIFEPESSNALGFGFRCGFLGLLHLEIVQERLRREYGQPIIATVPNVEYRVTLTDGKIVYIDNPAFLPSTGKIEKIEEPFVLVQIISPSEYIGNIMKLVMDRRGVYKNTIYVDKTRVSLHFDLPLSEIIFDFYDKLKSITRGYASLDYELADFKESDLVKLSILINGEPVDALSSIVHKEKAYFWGRSLCQKLRELIPRQLFEVAIQASIGSKVIARESVKPLRKNVTAKCYGGDITRKRKLLERQKEGKKRMKQVGSVEIPQEAFLAILQVER
ncbi:MAG: translation elongation factor 4 [candidate division Zixibacteria bacterium]|nr:translation elongation factor 4 [candidate division Zixibacteria bacterium]